MYRKHGPVHRGRRILGAIRRHPANAGTTWAALRRAGRWQAHKRVVRTPVDHRTSRGYVIRCYPDSQSASNIFYFTEWFDFHEMAFLVRYLRPGDSVLDVGANIGTYALLAASMVRRRGRVDAFEPHPVSFARLVENVRLNAWQETVVCHRAAAGAHNGDVDLLSDMDVSSRVVRSRDLAGRHYERVSCRPLDQVLLERDYAFAKIDVEGSEHEVLRGATAGLSRGNPPVMQLEILPGALHMAGTAPEQLIDQLAAHGYSLYAFEGQHRGLEPLAGVPRGNVLAIWQPRVGRVRGRLDAARA